MGGEVDEYMAELFLKGMVLLTAASPKDPIVVVMNNPGGDDYHGLGIYDAIAGSACHITIVAYGHAMSMGSWILQAADDRVLAPNCTVMIHYGCWPVDAELTRQQAAAIDSEYKRLNELMEQTYLCRMREKNPNTTLRQLQKLLEKESHFTAEQAVSLGLADKVLPYATQDK
jgi:ATP-dependent Clp endopeptidase proteolytic subunit ClpP